MSLSCNLDCDYMVEFSNDLITSNGTECCIECGQLILAGVAHYSVFEYYCDEDGEYVHLAKKTCCEECGDLAISFLDLGYCWTIGDVRNDISEMQAYA